MEPDRLFVVLTDEVPFEMRSRPIRLRVGSEEVLCDSVDEAKRRLTKRPTACQDDWAHFPDVDGKQVWVNLSAVLSEERALWAKQRALAAEPAPLQAPCSDLELLREGLRRRQYVPNERRLSEWTASSKISRSTLSTASLLTLPSLEDAGGEQDSRNRSQSQVPTPLV